MRIRSEAEADAGPIDALITGAFLTAAHSDGTEAAIVRRLRAADTLALSLVAERDGAIIGHVAASAVTVGGRAGWFGIGPLSVLLPHRRQGVGAALVDSALTDLRARGAAGTVLVGEPAYYGRFGFRSRPGVRVAGIPRDYVLVLDFGADRAAGSVVYHPAFGLAV